MADLQLIISSGHISLSASAGISGPHQQGCLSWPWPQPRFPLYLIVWQRVLLGPQQPLCLQAQDSGRVSQPLSRLPRESGSLCVSQLAPSGGRGLSGASVFHLSLRRGDLLSAHLWTCFSASSQALGNGLLFLALSRERVRGIIAWGNYLPVPLGEPSISESLGPFLREKRHSLACLSTCINIILW